MQERARTDDDLVLAVRAGDGDAYGELFERWFDRAYDVAYGVLRDRDAAVDAAQDALVAGWQRLDRLEDPAAFGGWLLRIARNRALDLLRHRARSRPSEINVVTWHHDRGARDPAAGTAPEGPADAASRIEREEMLSAATMALAPTDASLLDLHLRHGLTPAEIAEELGVTANAAHQKLFRMRARLGRAIAAFLLWQRGRPRCTVLAASLGDGTVFDADVFGSIERHRRSCAECADRGALMVAPERLFSALPVAVAPLAARRAAADALREAGVPLPDTAGGAAEGAPGPGGRSAADGSASDRPGRSLRPDGGRSRYVDVELVGAVLGSSGDGSIWATDETRTGAGAWWAAGRRLSSRRAMVAGVAALLIGAVAGLAMLRAGGQETTGALAPPTASTVDPTASAAPDSTGLRQGTGSVSTGDPGSGRTARSPSTSASSTSTTPTTAAPPAGVPSTTEPVSQPPAPIPPAAPRPDPVDDPPPPPVVTAPPPAPPVIAPPPAPVTEPPPPPAPKISRFTVAPGDPVLLCLRPSQSPRRFGWASVGGSSATLVVGETSRSVAPSGSTEVCAGSGQTATLTVSGDGGSAVADLVVP